MSHKSLTRYGYILKKDQLTPDEIKKIKDDLTVKPLILPMFKEFAKDTETAYPIFIESPQRLFVPRHYGIQKFGPPVINNLTPGKTINVQNIHDTIKLMPHQLKSFERSIEQLKDHGGGVLSLPCGFGKTIIALKIIATLRLKTLVLVNKEFLMDQWIERIEQCIPNAKVGIIQQQKFEVEDNDIVIGMIHTISKKEFPKDAFDDFSLVIADECHHLSAEMFSRALPKVATQYMLGLSATPRRKDGLSFVFYHHLGPLYHTERRTGNNVVFVKQIYISSYSPHYDLKYNTIQGKQFKNTKGMVGEICKFKERDSLIMVIIKELIKQNRKILLLTERREHLETFVQLLKDASIRNSQNQFVTFGLYYGKGAGVNKKNHKKILMESAKCDIVLGTCAMASEALDIPTLNTLILASPMTDVEQASGRILRKFHVGLNPLIIDLIDEFANFPQHAKLREKYFKSEGYVIEKYSLFLSNKPTIDPHAPNAYEKTLIPYLNDIRIPEIMPLAKHKSTTITTITKPPKSPKHTTVAFVQGQIKSQTKTTHKTARNNLCKISENKHLPNIPKGSCILDEE